MFKEYPKKLVGDPTKKQIAEFLEQAKEADKVEQEWELSDYDKYIADLYRFLAGFLHISRSDFEDMPIDEAYYHRDCIVKDIEKNLSDDKGKSMPISSEHWAFLLSLKSLFGGKKKR